MRTRLTGIAPRTATLASRSRATVGPWRKSWLPTASTRMWQATPRARGGDQGFRHAVGPAAVAPDIELEIAGVTGGVDIGDQGVENLVGGIQELPGVTRLRGNPPDHFGQPRHALALGTDGRPVDPRAVWQFAHPAIVGRAHPGGRLGPFPP